MSKYQYNEDMQEISGLGGGYEAACRKMVVSGLEFLDKHAEANPKFSTYENIYGIINENNEDAKKLTDAMAEVVGRDCTGAMMQACVTHVLYIKQNGWDKYVEEMIIKKAEKI